MPAPRLVFVDEFAINVAMTRTQARSARGQRAEVTEPFNYGTSHQRTVVAWGLGANDD